MKRVFSCLYLALSIMILASCKESLPDPIDEEQDSDEQIDDSNNQSLPDEYTFKDNVITYNEEMENYLEIVSNSLFRLSQSTPLNKIPKIGDIVFYHPDGTSKGMFIGKIININDDNNGWLVSTEIPSIDEVFDSFSLDFSMNASNTVVEYDATAEDGIEYCKIVDNSVWETIETVYHSEEDGNEDVEEGESEYTQSRTVNKSDKNQFPINVTLEFSPNTSSEVFDGKIYIRLEGSGVFSNDNIMMDVRTRIGLNGTLGVGTQDSRPDKDFPILQIKKGITLYTNKLVNICIKPSLVFTAEGRIRLEAGLNFEVLNSDIAIDLSSDDLLKKGGNHIRDNYFRVKSLKSEGELGLALKGNLYAFIFTEDFLSAGVEMKSGVKIKGEKNVGIQFPDIVNFDFSILATPFLELTPFVSSKATGKLQKRKGPTFSAETDAFSIELIPNFHDINYEIRDKKNLEVGASVSSQNSSFIESKNEGIAIFKKGDKTPIKNGSLRNATTKSSSKTLFFDIAEDEKYEIAPYIESEYDGYIYGERIPISDIRGLLEEFYKSTNGDNWYHNDNWCTDVPVEEWYGVELYEGDSEGYMLNLNDNNLTGDAFLGVNKLIKYINVQGNSLSSISFSKNTALTGIECNGNPLKSINLSGCSSLVKLYFEATDNNDIKTLTTLDVSGCSNLTTLLVYYNKLTSVNLDGCTSLEHISIYDNELTSLNVSSCKNLVYLNCQENNLTSLDVSGCKNLGHLACSDNNLTSLNVSGHTALTGIECNGNPLKSINLSGCSSLMYLYFEARHYNNIKTLTTLDVSGCSNLMEILVFNNKLTSVNLDGCTSLEYISIYDNELTSLDVSGCKNLRSLDCDNNYLNSLNVSSCENLEVLHCHNNRINSIITSFYQNLEDFHYDHKYTNYHEIDGVWYWTTNEYGWWYSGEPHRHYHR